jgi:hypothetical protein
MKKVFTYLLFALLYISNATGQINIFETFENGVPGAWTNDGALFFDTETESCDGTSIRANLWSFNTESTLTTQNFVAVSNNTDLNLSFDYKIVNFSELIDATPPGWGNFNLEYSLDGGNNWVLIDTINDDNHVTSNECATLNYTIDSADLPDGSDFQFRIDVTWAGGDYYLYIDSLFAQQTTTLPPLCDSVLITPADQAVDVDIETGLLWTQASNIPTDYQLTVGTSPGGNDVVDAASTGINTSHNFESFLEYSTTYYVSILPSNENGSADSETCQEFSFTTEEDPSIIVDCEVGPINESYCYGDNEFTEFLYSSSDGSALNLVFNGGFLESCCDDLIILDSDGTELYNDGGDVPTEAFQSSGDNLTVIIESDFSINCGDDNYEPIDYTVSCATCINPQVDYTVISNCDEPLGFSVEVEILDLGDAPSLDVTSNQGDPVQSANEPTTLTFGPYPLDVNVVFTVENVEDVNCTLTSPGLTDDCPAQNGTCSEATVATINPDNFCETVNLGTLFGATSSNVPVSCGGPVAQDVWFEFEATSNTIISTVIFDDIFGPSHAIYENDCGNLTEIYCSGEFDDGGFFEPYSPAIVAENLVIGETYKIRVFSDTVTDQDFELCLTTPQFNEDNATCDTSSAFCAPFDSDGNALPLIFPNGYFYLTESVAEPGPDYGCLGSQPNPAWFFIQVDETGDLAFNITQNSAFNGDGAPIGEELDVDFIAYGPFTEEESNCDVLTAANTVDCSFLALAVEEFTIPNAEAGEYYLLLITNYEQTPGYISLTQTNFGEPGAGSTNCDIVFQNQIAGCAGDEIILTATETDAVFYQWYIFNEDTEEFDPIIDANDPTLEVDSSGLYQVIAATEAGNITEDFEVSISPEPEVELPETLPLCGVPDVTLDGTVLNSEEYDEVSYQWFLEGEPITDATDATFIATELGNYSVVITTTILGDVGSDLICETSFNVEVNATDFTVSLGLDRVLCDAEPQTLTAVVEGEDATNASYLWSTGETTESITVSETDTYEVTVTIDGCSASDTVLYVFNESPIIALGPDSQTCDLEEFILDATPSNFVDGEVNYTWTLDNTLLEEDGPIINPNDYGFGTYQVNVFFDNPACSSTDSITLSLRDDISVNITSDDIDNLFCVDELVTFNASLQNAELVEADFQWFVNDEEEGENSPTLENYQITSTEANQVVRVEVTIGSLCVVSSELSFSLYDIDNCVISQGLSPDTTPGFNDNLDLRFLDDRSGISSLEIFNRYGQLVYEKVDYRDEFFGQSDNGNALETGTYFYVIKFDNPDEVYGQVHKGWIYINREQ